MCFDQIQVIISMKKLYFSSKYQIVIRTKINNWTISYFSFMKQGKLLDYNWDQREQRLKKRYRPIFFASCTLVSQLYMVLYQ